MKNCKKVNRKYEKVVNYYYLVALLDERREKERIGPTETLS